MRRPPAPNVAQRHGAGPERALRLATTGDAAAIQAIYAPIVLHTTTSFEEAPPTVDEMARRIAATVAVRPWLVCEIGGAVAGDAYAGAHRERAACEANRFCSAHVVSEDKRPGETPPDPDMHPSGPLQNARANPCTPCTNA